MPRVYKPHLWIAGMVTWLLLAPMAWGCGKERWPVKVGTDRDVQQVMVTPTLSTIVVLTRIDAPLHPGTR